MEIHSHCGVGWVARTDRAWLGIPIAMLVVGCWGAKIGQAGRMGTDRAWLGIPIAMLVVGCWRLVKQVGWYRPSVTTDRSLDHRRLLPGED